MNIGLSFESQTMALYGGKRVVGFGLGIAISCRSQRPVAPSSVNKKTDAPNCFVKRVVAIFEVQLDGRCCEAEFLSPELCGDIKLEVALYSISKSPASARSLPEPHLRCSCQSGRNPLSTSVQDWLHSISLPSSAFGRLQDGLWSSLQVLRQPKW